MLMGWARALVSPPEFSDYREAVREQNLSMMKGLCLGCLIVSFGAVLLELIDASFGFKGAGAYALAALSVVGCVSTRTVLARRLDIVLVAYYAFLGLMLLLFILMGTVWDTESAAITFIMFMVMLPLFVLDRPWRIALFIGAATVLFCFLATMFKSPELALADVRNSVSFCFMGIAINAAFMRVKLNDVVTRAEFEKLSTIDSLTGVLNRRSGESLIEWLLEAREEGVLSALAMVDIDDFKQVNDTHGHSVGDGVLLSVTQAIERELRPGDVLCRLGGDEFVVFFSKLASREEGVALAQRFVENVRQGHEEATGTSVSVGVAYCPDSGTDFASLYQAADQALYRSKGEGKNRVACAGQVA